MKKEKDQFDFEDTLELLEAIVGKLESGKLKLDESITAYEKGVELYKSCRKKLNEVEKKVTILTENLEESEID